jgi:hypothetical protein
MFFELLIKELEYLCDIGEAVGSFYLLVPATEQDVLMVRSVPGTLSVNHNELDIMLTPLDIPLSVLPPVFLAVLVRHPLPH